MDPRIYNQSPGNGFDERMLLDISESIPGDTQALQHFFEIPVSAKRPKHDSRGNQSDSARLLETQRGLRYLQLCETQKTKHPS